jgi:hypothetical protein
MDKWFLQLGQSVGLYQFPTRPHHLTLKNTGSSWKSATFLSIKVMFVEGN